MVETIQPLHHVQHRASLCQTSTASCAVHQGDKPTSCSRCSQTQQRSTFRAFEVVPPCGAARLHLPGLQQGVPGVHGGIPQMQRGIPGGLQLGRVHALVKQHPAGPEHHWPCLPGGPGSTGLVLGHLLGCRRPHSTVSMRCAEPQETETWGTLACLMSCRTCMHRVCSPPET